MVAEEKKAEKKKKLWVIIPVAFVVSLLGSLTGMYFYFFYYLKPNFESGPLNKITSSIKGKVSPGQEITYTVEYKNTGNVTVTGLTVNTSVPQNTEFVSALAEAVYDGKIGGAVTFNAGALEKGQSGRFYFTVRVINPCDDGTVIKSNRVFFEYMSRDAKNSFEINQFLESTVTSSPDFSVFTVTVKDFNGRKISIGDLLEFTVLLKNSGDMNAKDVKIIDTVSPKLLADRNSLPPGAEFDPGRDQVAFSVAEIKAGELKSFSFRAEVGQDFRDLEVFNNTAQVEYEGRIENEVSLEKEVHGFPDFSLSSSTVADIDGGSVWAGDILEFEIGLKNSGVAPGRNFSVICPLPEGTSPVEGSIKDFQNAEYDKENNRLIYSIEELGAGKGITLSFKAKISSSMIRGGKIESAFYIEGNDQYFEIQPVSISVRSYIFTTVVCMGDSQIITTNWPAMLDYLLESRYPHAEFTVIASGVNQEMAYQGARRFDGTVAVYRPQVVVFGYGTNDTGNPAGTAILSNGTNDLISRARAIGAAPIVHSIGWIDIAKHELKKGVNSYNSALRDVCTASGVPFVDIYGPMSSDPEKYVSGDGMHWTQDGGGLVATLVFNTLIDYLDSEGKRN